MKYLVYEQEDMTTTGITFYVPNYFQETKTYNQLYQLTRQTTIGAGGTAAQKKAATKAMLLKYNSTIATLRPLVTEDAPPAALYGETFVDADLPVFFEHQADRVLALPHHQYLTPDQIIYVAESINAFYGA